MKIKYFLPVLSIIFLASCSNDENAELGNASDQINAIAGELNDDVVTLVQSDGVNGARTLFDLIENSNQFGRVSPYQMDENRALVTNQIDRISYSFTAGIARLLNEEPADFAENKGVYVWNFDLEDFEKTDDSEFIVLAFPTEGSTTNNAEFRLTEFTVIEIDGEELPTTIKADLSIDNDPLVDEDPVIELDFVVNYSADGNPEVADIYLVAIPFALDITFDDSETSTTSLAVALLLNSESLVAVDVDVEFDSEAKLEPKTISGEVSYRTLRIVGSVSDDQMDNSLDSDPNDYIDLALFVGEDKKGDIVFLFEEIIEDGEIYEDYVPYVEYADGSKEKLEEILEPVIDEIEVLLEDFE